MTPEILLSNGKFYNFVDPDPDVIDIQMVAAALSKICRFTGQVSRYYSVAEHSWRGSFFVPAEDRLEMLLHDASESLIADLATPFKVLLGESYGKYERLAEQAIATRFKLRWPFPPSIKIADRMMLGAEKNDLLPPTDRHWEILDGVTIPSLNLGSSSGRPETWEKKFLARYQELAR
jgi:hypothetical protein